MLERLLLITLLGVGGVAFFHLIRQAHVRRMPTRAVQSGTPTLLYFRSDTCTACRTQARYIDQLAASWDGRLAIETIDADRDRNVAARYGVLTLPMTIWLDQGGQATQVNYGLTETGKLERQLISLLAVLATDQPQ